MVRGLQVGSFDRVRLPPVLGTEGLILVVGPVPIMRPKDHVGEKIDNTASFLKLIEVRFSTTIGAAIDVGGKALESGDAITLFPEGISRYYPEVAPLKTGVARIASDTLTRNRHDPTFEITIVTCSVTYLSSPPPPLDPRAHVSYITLDIEKSSGVVSSLHLIPPSNCDHRYLPSDMTSGD